MTLPGLGLYGQAENLFTKKNDVHLTEQAKYANDLNNNKKYNQIKILCVYVCMCVEPNVDDKTRLV